MPAQIFHIQRDVSVNWDEYVKRIIPLIENIEQSASPDMSVMMCPLIPEWREAIYEFETYDRMVEVVDVYDNNGTRYPLAFIGWDEDLIEGMRHHAMMGMVPLPSTDTIH